MRELTELALERADKAMRLARAQHLPRELDELRGAEHDVLERKATLPKECVSNAIIVELQAECVCLHVTSGVPVGVEDDGLSENWRKRGAVLGARRARVILQADRRLGNEVTRIEVPPGVDDHAIEQHCMKGVGVGVISLAESGLHCTPRISTGKG